MDKVLVMGANGMLGWMVRDYLQKMKGFDVWGSVRPGEKKEGKNLLDFEATETGKDLEKIIKKIRPEWIINCIGIIKPYCKDDDPVGVKNAIIVNALFPYLLASVSEKYDARVIQIATDCVFSGASGNYDESAPHDALDVYGKTKSLGESRNPAMLHIRCSIIGREKFTKVSLLEWFLSQKDGSTIQGFTNHIWNGVTTQQFAQLCGEIMRKGPKFFDKLVATSLVHHFVPNKTITKYELLTHLEKEYKQKITIEPVVAPGSKVDRSLTTRFHLLPKISEIPWSR